MNLVKEILKLKKSRNALVLAHYYEDGIIQDVADFVGDSFQLALKARESPHPVVVMAGVVFMAESIKIMNPHKTVLVPDWEAGCSLVDSAPATAIKSWKDKFAKPFLVTYINSSAELKSISDVIVTSSNAVGIVKKIPSDYQVLFAPDRNLGQYVQAQVGRPMEIWNGTCEVHVKFSARALFELKSQYPEAVVLAHPECDPAVLAQADLVGSTSKLLEAVTKYSAKQFIVATEPGIFHQMRKKRPDATFIQAPGFDAKCPCHVCPYMKLNTLEKIYHVLDTLSNSVELPEELIQKARLPLERMIQWANIQ